MDPKVKKSAVRDGKEATGITKPDFKSWSYLLLAVQISLIGLTSVITLQGCGEN